MATTSNDPQCRNALPLDSVNEVIQRPGTPLREGSGHGDIPHIDAALIGKYATDLQAIHLI